MFHFHAHATNGLLGLLLGGAILVAVIRALARPAHPRASRRSTDL
jgi:hypothetical protein